MTRSRILATLVALLAFAGTASARIQVEPVERDGRDLVPIAMDFGFEQGGERRGEIPWNSPHRVNYPQAHADLRYHRGHDPDLPR